MAHEPKSRLLKGHKVVLAVTGGIACYKSAELTRAMVRQGAEVTVVMTENAKKFITPLTFQTLSGRTVFSDLFAGTEDFTGEHIALADWADIIVVAPATANIIGKYAAGIADDLPSTLLLAADGPVLLAPAMNKRMWNHPAVQDNVRLLVKRGVALTGPDEGRLACGTTGTGRMSEPDTIVAKIKSCLKRK
ncbi:MAG: bifunctional phosphopantothenoylcysteine decarboxylase/phosphopantothenate--cysteine ligase CoaBC [Planctomycetia bacterium]|nr:bifunctional phosphopantothenoylcysteine decarboxylase/phosphopantothenate--cysteine ligase CoaBC [Planctomycetia bacterium]